jgi:hypothetical protein
MGGAKGLRMLRGFTHEGKSRRGEAATPYLWLQPQHMNRRFFNLEIGDWTLDVGCWMLDVGCWMLDVGCWMLDVQV